MLKIRGDTSALRYTQVRAAILIAWVSLRFTQATSLVFLINTCVIKDIVGIFTFELAAGLCYDVIDETCYNDVNQRENGVNHHSLEHRTCY